MQMDSRIILAGQQPDFVNTLARSSAAAGVANQVRDQNALRSLYQQQGPQIMAGDPNALNALARQSPQAAMGVQADRLGMDATRQRMDVLSAEEKRAIEAHALRMSEAERQQEAAKIEQGLMTAVQAWQAGDLDGVNQILTQAGEQPIPSLEQFPAIAARYKSIYDVVTRVQDQTAGPKAADEYQRYVQEEAAAGRQPLSRIDFAKAKQKSSSIEVGPDGSVRIVEGSAADSGRIKPSSPEAMVATIDGILQDPALNTSTGILSPLQKIPGTPQRRFGARASQLEGQAFLQAFESLKGGGQITEIEGIKATQAVGRLDTAQAPEDYRAALEELREILVTAASRPVGWAQSQGGAKQQTEGIPDFSSMTDEELDAFIAEQEASNGG